MPQESSATRSAGAGRPAVHTKTHNEHTQAVRPTYVDRLVAEIQTGEDETPTD
jgi:hypothetical protein